MATVSGSCISFVHTFIPTGMLKTISAPYRLCLLHSSVMSLGTIITWHDRCRLSLACLNCSMANLATAGGGAHNMVPDSYAGILTPSQFVLIPDMSCPLQNQSLGVNTSILLWNLPSMQSLNLCSKPGLLSKALLCIGMKSNIRFPVITPSIMLPLDRPSVPCSIILVPATCIN